MKVLAIKTGEILDVNSSYAYRLIEHGRAVVYKAAKAEKTKASKTTATTETEKGDE